MFNWKRLWQVFFLRLQRERFPATSAQKAISSTLLDISPIGKGHIESSLARKWIETPWYGRRRPRWVWSIRQEKWQRPSRLPSLAKKVAQVGESEVLMHIHLIPMNSEADVNFRKEHLNHSEDNLEILTKSTQNLKINKLEMTNENEKCSKIARSFLISHLSSLIITKCILRPSSFALHSHINKYEPMQRNLLLADQEYIVLLSATMKPSKPLRTASLPATVWWCHDGSFPSWHQ